MIAELLRSHPMDVRLNCPGSTGRDCSLTGSDLARRVGGILAVLHRRQLTIDDRVGVAVPAGPSLVAATLGVLMFGSAVLLRPWSHAARLTDFETFRLVGDRGGFRRPDVRSRPEAIVTLDELPDADLDSWLAPDGPSNEGRLSDGAETIPLNVLWARGAEATTAARIDPSSVVGIGFGSRSTGSSMSSVSLLLAALATPCRITLFDDAFARRQPRRWQLMLAQSGATHVLVPSGLTAGPAPWRPVYREGHRL